MSKRDEEVLSSVIAAFSETGKAVGSDTLAKYLGNRFSSATIRNVMRDLENMGLLAHLHTSGGRLPTDRGVRYYVDKMLKLDDLSEEMKTEIESKYRESSYRIEDIFKMTSGVLSSLSSYAGLVVTPRVSEIRIKHMEYLLLSQSRILGIFVGQDGMVENRIMKVEESFNYSDLEKMNNYCNRTFYDLTLAEAKDKVAKEMYQAKTEYDEFIVKTLLMSGGMLSDIEKNDLLVDGGGQLLSMPDFLDASRAGSLMDVLEEKRGLIELLGRTMESDSVNIFIGSESGYEQMADCSVVSASYAKEGKVVGTLGVIGPIRMDYSKVIPIVNCTAKLISEFLEGM